VLKWVSTPAVRSSHTSAEDSWVAAVEKWTAPVKTIEKVKKTAGFTQTMAGRMNKAEI
jgi:hypothetical protein